MRLQSSGPRTCLVGLVPSISVKGSMRLQGSLGGCDEFALLHHSFHSLVLTSWSTGSVLILRKAPTRAGLSPTPNTPNRESKPEV